MKIYARQIAPEYQESPLFHDDIYENIIFTGNRNYISRTTPEYDHVTRYFDEMAAEWDDRNYSIFLIGGCAPTKIKRYPRPSLAEILRDYGFKRNDGKPWTTKQRHAWRLLMEETPSEDETICEALGLLTGKQWTSSNIRGCCQGDWQGIFYSMDDYNDDDIEQIETEYFNTGTEWEIHDDPTPPETPQDICGCHIYCHAWNDDGIKKEIADATGSAPENVVLYKHDGYIKTPKYKEV